MQQQAVNITQLVLAEHPQGWAANRALLGQMRKFSGTLERQLPQPSNLDPTGGSVSDLMIKKVVTLTLFPSRL